MFSFLWDVTMWWGKNVFCLSDILVSDELMEEDCLQESHDLSAYQKGPASRSSGVGTTTLDHHK